MRPARAPALAAAVLIALAAAPASAALRATPGSPAGEPRGGRLSPVMTEDGVLFRYRSPAARAVAIVGPFNGWDERALPLARGRGGVWSRVVDLDEGRWPYLFVVDGTWVADPDNPVLADVEDGAADLGERSLVEIEHDEILLPRPPGFRAGETSLAGSYDRVNQVTLTARLSYENRARRHPELSFAGGWSFGRERWLYDLSVVQPLFGPDALDVGAGAYRANATPDDWRIGDTENSLAAFFFRQDWRDWHEAEGVTAFLRVGVGPDDRVTVRWRGEDHRAVAKTTDWGLFEGSKRMRANRPADEGELRSFELAWDRDTRNHPANPTRGAVARVGWEWAGGGLGGDFEFQRGVAEVRRYVTLSPGHFLDVRLLGGVLDEASRGGAGGPVTGWDAVPEQERFHLGGIGTMRATRFKSISGDRMFLANAEVRVEVFRELQAVVFADLGDAWVEDRGEFDLKADAGIGFQDSDASFRVNLARKVDDRPGDDGLFVSARINRMF